MTTQPETIRNEHTLKNTEGGKLGDPGKNYTLCKRER